MTKAVLVGALGQLKWRINQVLQASGYSLVRNTTLDRLVAEATGKMSAVELDEPGPVFASAPAPEIAAEPPPAPAPHSNGDSGRALPQPILKLLPVANRAPRICTALAPKFDPEKNPCRLADQIVQFQQQGIAVIDTSPQKASIWREREPFDRDTTNRHPVWDWAGPDIAPFNDHIRTGLPSPALVEDLRQLFSGDDFEGFFRGVLGCPAALANARLVESLPHSAEGAGPQAWHDDGCPAGVIRGVLYLTDVDQDTGPFQYKDEDGTVHTVLGKAGDLLVFDAMRLMHRALPPTRHVRMAIDLIFMPRLPEEEFYVIVAGVNHWPADPFFYSLPAERRET